jgi:hypothetical protein
MHRKEHIGQWKCWWSPARKGGIARKGGLLLLFPFASASNGASRLPEAAAGNGGHFGVYSTLFGIAGNGDSREVLFGVATGNGCLPEEGFFKEDSTGNGQVFEEVGSQGSTHFGVTGNGDPQEVLFEEATGNGRPQEEGFFKEDSTGNGQVFEEVGAQG